MFYEACNWVRAGGCVGGKICPPFLDNIAISAFNASTSCACNCTNVCRRCLSSTSFFVVPASSSPFVYKDTN